MTHSALQLAALAAAVVPGLIPVTVDPPHVDGMDYDFTIITDDQHRHWVVRAPRNAAAAASLDSEQRLLPLIARHLPVPVPAPANTTLTTQQSAVNQSRQHTAAQRAAPPTGTCLVYPHLSGNVLDLELLTPGSALAIELGRTLGALHELDTRIIDEVGLPGYTAQEYRQRRLSDVDRAASTGRVPAALLTRWEQQLENVSYWQFVPTPIHGDLASEHILVYHHKISGIIDWGAACIADPADDFAWLAVGADPAVLDTVLEAYAMARTHPPDRHLRHRAHLAGELALVRWLLSGLTAENHSIVDRATAALSNLAEQLPPVADPVTG